MVDDIHFDMQPARCIAAHHRFGISLAGWPMQDGGDHSMCGVIASIETLEGLPVPHIFGRAASKTLNTSP
jgi:hypothetical protein